MPAQQKSKLSSATTSNRRSAIKKLSAGFSIALALSTALAVFPEPVKATETYPEKAVRIVVPYPPGGFNDTLGRLMAGKLAEKLGQPFIVENKPGAGTMIGTAQVAKALPDGYTLLVNQFPFAANPWLYPNMNYDTTKDFVPVMLAGRSPMVLVVNAESSIKTVEDLLKKAKANPGALNYGSSGNGSSNHLAMALFERMAGVSMTQIPYKGSTPLLTDLAGGSVELAFDALPHVLPFIQSGKIRPVAVAGFKQAPALPGIPTVDASGVKGYDVSSWHGFVAPAGTPEAVIQKLNQAMNQILKMTDVQETFAAQGVVIDGGTAENFNRFIDDQLFLWKRVIEESNIVIN